MDCQGCTVESHIRERRAQPGSCDTNGFDWQTAVEIFDSRDDYGEDRWVASGFIGVALYVMAYIERGDTLRIISLRGATKKEEKIYAQGT